MAEVTLTIGDRRYPITARDGEEAQVQMLGERMAQFWPTASRASGGLSGERTMLFIALMLADALNEAENRPPPDGSASPQQLEGLATRLEKLAEALEAGPANA